MSPTNYDDLDAKVATLLSKDPRDHGIINYDSFDVELTSLLHQYKYTGIKYNLFSRINGNEIDIFGKKNPLVFLPKTHDDYFYIRFPDMKSTQKFFEDIIKNQSEMTCYKPGSVIVGAVGAVVGLAIAAIATITKGTEDFFDTATYTIPILTFVSGVLGYKLLQLKYQKQVYEKLDILRHYEPEQFSGKRAISQALTRPIQFAE